MEIDNIVNHKEGEQQASTFNFQHTNLDNDRFSIIDETRSTPSTYVIRNNFKTNFYS